MSATQFQVFHRQGSTGRHGAALAALSDAAERVADTFQLWRRRARERDQLSRMDDRMLTDIGISRAEALMLSDKPFWQE